MDKATSERVIAQSRGERYSYDDTLTWVDFFAEQARANPEKTAVVAENGSLSYGELDRLSDRLASALVEQEGVQPDEFVAVRMGRVVEFHVAVLAIHKAGAAYMPIDLDYPVDRVAYMMEDSGARLTLTEQRVAELLKYAGEADVFLRRCRPDSRAWPGIRQTAAEVRKNTLVLYYTASEVVDEAALSAFMAESLADYMIPGAFVQLDAMPHNVNGKIDRKALPDPVLHVDREYVAPETDAERDAVSAMAKVLGVAEPLGVTHDFFELGGDSIKAIRLVSALRNMGYAAAVADVMKARTARALAAGLAASAPEDISQEPIEGPVADTAIFAFFRDLNYPNPAYYNQSTLLTVREKADLDALQRASDAIARQHDMLRAVIRDGHLFVRPASARIIIEEYTLEADSAGAVRALCEDIQSHLDIEQSLVRLALIHAGARDLFFLTAHHTIVDGVSWRVWMDDLETGYGQALRGKAIVLSAKSHTYRDYAEAMKAYRSSYALSLELPYWKNVEARMLALDTSDNKDYTRHFETLSAAMSEEDTRAFLKTRLNALRLEVNDLLLTALGQGYRQAFGKDAVSVSMEGHGREDLGKKLSVDRTIGWFTSIYPVVLEGFTGEAKDDLIRVKETLHAIPNKGVGYNIVAFVEGTPETDFRTDRAPMVIFNYLGDVSGEGENGEYFAPDSADGFSAGLDYYGPRNHDGSDLVVNCLVDGGASPSGWITTTLGSPRRRRVPLPGRDASAHLSADAHAGGHAAGARRPPGEPRLSAHRHL